MRNFNYSRAATADDALQLISAVDSARFLGGGTNLVDLMRENIEQPAALVDVTRIQRGDIEETAGGGLSIGAGVKNSAAANHPPRARTRAWASAARPRRRAALIISRLTSIP